MNVFSSETRILFIAGSPRAAATLAVLRGAGHVCESVATAEAGLQRLAAVDGSAGDAFDLVVWDADEDGRSVDEMFDKGRYRTSVPALLLLPRLYPFVAASGRRPGVFDYLVKPVAPRALLAAVEDGVRLAKARRYVDHARAQAAEALLALEKAQALLAPLQAPPPRDPAGGRTPSSELSHREEEIAARLAQGHRAPAIARLLNLSTHTVRNHLKAIFRKLEVHSQVELMARLRDRRPGV